MRNKGLTMIELAAGALLAGVLAMAASFNFDEADLRARVARTHDGLQRVAAAMEAYNIDNDGYPAAWRDSPLGAPSTTISTDLRLLTTPVGYTTLHSDPFRPAGGTAYWIYGVGYSSPNQFSYGVYPRSTFIAWSFGPDQKTQTGGYRTLRTVLANEALANPPQDQYNGIRYDPTNGLLSTGDIYYFGPLSEAAPQEIKDNAHQGTDAH